MERRSTAPQAFVTAILSLAQEALVVKNGQGHAERLAETTSALQEIETRAQALLAPQAEQQQQSKGG